MTQGTLGLIKLAVCFAAFPAAIFARNFFKRNPNTIPAYFVLFYILLLATPDHITKTILTMAFIMVSVSHFMSANDPA